MLNEIHVHVSCLPLVLDINECSNNPCINGSCTNTAGSYQCQCFNGWTGTNCDQSKSIIQTAD